MFNQRFSEEWFSSERRRLNKAMHVLQASQNTTPAYTRTVRDEGPRLTAQGNQAEYPSTKDSAAPHGQPPCRFPYGGYEIAASIRKSHQS